MMDWYLVLKAFGIAALFAWVWLFLFSWRYAVRLPAWLVFNLCAWLAAPVLPLFAVARDGLINNGNDHAVEPRLPRWLSWFMTWDNSLYGDNGHKERWGHAGSYRQMVAWLLRNPAYGFEREVLGAKITPSDRVQTNGNPWIKNRTRGVEGRLFVWIGNYWCWKRVIDTNDGYCWMFEAGWKLQPYAQDGRRTATEPVAQLVLSLRRTEFWPD